MYAKIPNAKLMTPSLRVKTHAESRFAHAVRALCR
jgi:hypothetical protein